MELDGLEVINVSDLIKQLTPEEFSSSHYDMRPSEAVHARIAAEAVEGMARILERKGLVQK